MSIRVFIDGGEGTTGLRLRDRLGGREEITLLQIDPALRKDTAEKARVASSADVVFLCLPDGAAKAAAENITNPAVKVIDASTAHRVDDAWTYGFPELSGAHREAVAAASRVSNPGCHATGFSALVYPLVSQGVTDADFPFTAHSITGYSGGGKGVIAQYTDPNRASHYSVPRQYGLGQQHKHLPEMQKISGLKHQPVFSPIICDFYAGMVVTVPVPVHLLNKYRSIQDLHRFFADYYAGQKLVKVMPFGAEQAYDGGMIDAEALAGLDLAEIFVCGNDDRAVLITRLDNLGKGASGAAIQNMNILCGLPEETGLALTR